MIRMIVMMPAAVADVTSVSSSVWSENFRIFSSLTGCHFQVTLMSIDGALGLPLGSILVWHNQALALLPMFYISNALLLEGLVQEQAMWRTATLHAQIVAIIAEIGWNAFHPSALSIRTVALSLFGAAFLNLLQLLTLYGTQHIYIYIGRHIIADQHG